MFKKTPQTPQKTQMVNFVAWDESPAINSVLAGKREKATLNKLGLKDTQSRRFTMKHTSGLTGPLAFVTRSLSISADGSTQPYPAVTGAAAICQLAGGLRLKSFLRLILFQEGQGYS